MTLGRCLFLSIFCSRGTPPRVYHMRRTLMHHIPRTCFGFETLSAAPSDPTVGVYLGPYGEPTGEGGFYGGPMEEGGFLLQEFGGPRVQGVGSGVYLQHPSDTFSGPISHAFFPFPD